MFDSSFPITALGPKSEYPDGHEIIRVYQYSFKTNTNFKYFINVEEYRHKVLVVKFHARNRTKSQYKYNELTNKNIPFKVFGTVLNLMLSLLKKEKYSDYSFGFLGATKVKKHNEKGKTITKEESFNNTQRFRIYSKIAANTISSKNFQHYTYPELSAYLFINKGAKNIEAEKDKLQKLFYTVYEQLHPNRLRAVQKHIS